MQLNNFKFKLALPSYTQYDDKGKEIKTFKKHDLVSLNEILVMDKDVWNFERKNNRTGETFSSLIIKHYKVQEIKRLAGLVIFKEPELIVSPSIENGMTAAFAGNMRLPGDRHKVDLVIGEANKGNTQIDYIVSMAYKRWYDRAVLDALELFEMYSDIEADELRQESGQDTAPALSDLTPEEVKVITPFVQTINQMKDASMLNEYGDSLKVLVPESNASEKAKLVLRALYQRKLAELNGKQQF